MEFIVDFLVRMIRYALVSKLTHLLHYSTMWRSCIYKCAVVHRTLRCVWVCVMKRIIKQE